jgi:hypothetical protein
MTVSVTSQSLTPSPAPHCWVVGTEAGSEAPLCPVQLVTEMSDMEQSPVRTAGSLQHTVQSVTTRHGTGGRERRNPLMVALGSL